MTAVSEPFDLADVERRLTELEALAELVAFLKLDQPERWMPITKAAGRIGMPRKTLVDWCKNGSPRLPESDRRKMRGMWFVNPAWVASQAALNPRKDTA